MENEVKIKNVLWYLYKRKWRVFVFILLGMICMYLLSSRVWKKEYASTTELYLWNKTEAIQDSVLLQMQIGQEVAGDYKYLVQSQVVADKVIDKLNLPYGYGELKNKISVTNPEGTRIIEITAYDENPEMAKQIADHIAQISKEDIEKLMDSIEVEILMEGSVSYNSVGPDIQKNAVFGGILGGILGAILVFIPYFMSNHICTSKQAEQCLKMEVLGEIPNVRKRRKSKRIQMQVQDYYKRLRTRLLVKENLGNVIAIISSKSKEGKTAVAFQLAKTIIKLQKKVLLLDTDTRQGSIKREGDEGLLSYLSDQTEEENLVLSTGINNLSRVIIGEHSDAGAELFYTKKFVEILQKWKREYDYIIVDTTSMEFGTEACVVGKACDSVIFLIQYDRIDYRLAQNRILELEKTGSHVIGVILNQMNMREAKEYV